MNSEADREFPELDAQLAKLPQWQPPADFAARLAAAAARQAPLPVERPATRRWLLASLLAHLPLAAGAGLLALLLAVLPWTEWMLPLPWALAAVSAVAGMVLTLRLLRAP